MSYRERQIQEALDDIDIEIPVENGDEVEVTSVYGVHGVDEDNPATGRICGMRPKSLFGGTRRLGGDVAVDVCFTEDEATWVRGNDKETYLVGGFKGKDWDDLPIERR